LRQRYSGVCAVLTLGFLASGMHAAQAQDQDQDQDQPTNPGAQIGRRILSSLLSTGAYIFTSDAARAAFGDVYFYSENSFHGRPRSFSNFQVSGGIDLINISSKFFPFSSGNQLTLVGPSFRVTTTRQLRRPRPYLSGGLYYGNLNSDRLANSSNAFVPSLSIGIEYALNNNIAITAGFRAQGEIGGINTNGFLVQLRVF